MKYNHNPLTNSRRVLWEIAITCMLLVAIAVPRLAGLDRFVTTDETLWLSRAGKFYYALAHHDLTFARNHPGVTVMWAGLGSYLLEYPEHSEGRKGEDHPVTLLAVKLRQFNTPLHLLVMARRILILFNLLVLVAGFLFAQQIFGRLPALMGFLLIAFDPFHIALTKILHLDGTLGNLLLLSLLAFLAYLERRHKIALIVSAGAAALAVLTKSPGIFLIPFIVLLTLLYRLFSKGEYDKTNWWKFVRYDVKTLAIWGAIAVFVFCLLWPAMWVHPINTLTKVFTVAMEYAEEGHESAVFFNGHIYPNGKIPDISFYLINFLWRTTPVTLLGLLAAPVLLIRKKNLLYSENNQRWAVVALLFFALGFGAFMTMGLKKFDRYILPSIVTLDLVAGVSLVWLVQWIVQLLRERWRTGVTTIILLSLVTVQAVLAWKAFPYFFTYYNPLLGGSRQAIKVMQIGWGEGLDQAARYLNEKPNANRLRVMAWYADGPFLFLSKSRFYALTSEWTTVDQDEFDKADYIVVYIHQWQRNIPAELLDRLRGLQPEYSVWIDGLEYVRVYKIH